LGCNVSEDNDFIRIGPAVGNSRATFIPASVNFWVTSSTVDPSHTMMAAPIRRSVLGTRRSHNGDRQTLRRRPDVKNGALTAKPLGFGRKVLVEGIALAASLASVLFDDKMAKTGPATEGKTHPLNEVAISARRLS
jgi:hypothetical protein